MKLWILFWLTCLTTGAQAKLSTIGARVVDAQGKPHRFVGINWFGFETETHVAHGLWARGYRELMAQVKELGFNLIRVPYSNAILAPKAMPTGIDYAANPDLEGLTALQVLDKIVTHAATLGIDIMLDRHRPGPSAQSELWHTPEVPEERWIGDWVALARRYRSNGNVVAFDLHNEPHDPATWGTGGALDWRLAAERAGSAVLEENPDLLVVVEGIQSTAAGSYWWGGNLSEAARAPVRLPVAGRLVYSAHDYPASVHPHEWFSSPDYPANLPAVWGKFWGFIAASLEIPVFLGEFGTKLKTSQDRLWLETLADYLRAHQIPFAFWCLNPNSADTGGILENDWKTVNRAKLELLRRAL